jgi:hypothetical protein
VDRTDAAQDIAVHIVRGIVHLQAIRCLARNIISHMDEDDIVIFVVVISLNDLVVKFMDQVIVL